MTLDYVTNNPCVLSINRAWGVTNLEANRKTLYTEIFFMFFVYFLSQVLHTFKYKNTGAYRSSVQHSLIPTRLTQLSQPNQQGKDERPELPWHQKRWNRNFSFLFSSHAIALGMVILFSPLTGAIIIAYFHFVAYALYCFCQFKYKFTISRLFRILMDIFNIVLMIIGATGISYAQYCKNSKGNLVCCNQL